MKNLSYYVVLLAAVLGLCKTGYHFIVDSQSVVLSGYFHVSLLFILIAGLLDRTRSSE